MVLRTRGIVCQAKKRKGACKRFFKVAVFFACAVLWCGGGVYFFRVGYSEATMLSGFPLCLSLSVSLRVGRQIGRALCCVPDQEKRGK